MDSRVVLSIWCLGLVTFLVAQCFATTGNAQTSWTNPGGGFWHSGSNWAGGSPPGPAGTAIFNLPNTYIALWNNSFGDSVTSGLVVGGGNVTFSNTSPSTRTHSVIGSSAITGSGTSLTAGSFPGNILQLTSGGMVVNSGGQVVATAGSRISTPGLLTVGSAGSGTLTAQAGGIIEALLARIGDGGSGSALVTGAGSQMNIGPQLGDGLMVGVSGTGLMNIQNGGMVTASSTTSFIGANTGSTGTVNVTGVGSRLVLDSVWEDDLAIGGNGTGILNILDGGFVTNRQAFVGLFSGGTGTINVSGTGSTWQITDLRMLNGTLNVQAGGIVTMSASGIIGEAPGGINTATVSGAGSSLTSANTLNVGGITTGSTGVLNVLDGGHVSTFLGRVGLAEGSNGTATIAGNGSAWTMFGRLDVGIKKSGALDCVGVLNVQSGGLMTSDGGRLGDGFGNAYGTVTVTGAGSSWINSGYLDVGLDGTGAVNVENQGLVSVAGVTMIGKIGNGTMNVASGSVVTNTKGFVGHETGSIGTVTVTGSGSQWNNSDSLQVGRFGTGTLNIADGGSVSVVNLSAIDVDGQINNSNGSFVSNTVINQPGGVISGHGQFTTNAGWANFGSMAFDGGVANVVGAVTNGPGGMISSSNGATTVFHSDVILNNTNIATDLSSSTIFKGTVSGTGNFTGVGTIIIDGAFRPGNSPGIVSFEGGLNFGVENTTYIELGGVNPDQFDRLLVDGQLSLNNSSLDVSLLNTFNLSSNMQFLIADVAEGLLGQFDGLSEGSQVGNFGGTELFITYVGGNGNDIVLYTNGMLGDVNGDGVVSLLDVSPFINALTSGIFNPAADINQDGVVNLLDVNPFVALLVG